MAEPILMVCKLTKLKHNTTGIDVLAGNYHMILHLTSNRVSLIFFYRNVYEES